MISSDKHFLTNDILQVECWLQLTQSMRSAATDMMMLCCTCIGPYMSAGTEIHHPVGGNLLRMPADNTERK